MLTRENTVPTPPITHSRKSLVPLAAGSILIIISISVALLLLGYHRFSRRVVNADGVYSAQVARNLLEGKGYRTSELSLYEVALYGKNGWLQDGPPWKNANRFPLQVATRVGLYKFFGVSFFTGTSLESMIFYVLSAFALFGVGYSLFQNLLVGLMAAVIFVTHPLFLYNAMSGKGETADYFFFILLIFCLYKWVTSGERQQWWGLAVGATIGVAFLNRYNSAIYFPLAILVLIGVSVLRRQFQVRRTLMSLVPLSLGVVPFIVPIVYLSEKMFGMVFFSSNAYFQFPMGSRFVKFMNPWWKLEYPFDVAHPFAFFVQHPVELLLKWGRYALPDIFLFLSFGTRDQGMTMWWWLPLVFLSIMAVRTAWRGEMAKRLRNLSGTDCALVVISGVIVCLFIVQLIVVPLFGAGVNYFWYLYMGVTLMVAYGLVRALECVRSCPNPRPLWSGFVSRTRSALFVESRGGSSPEYVGGNREESWGNGVLGVVFIALVLLAILGATARAMGSVIFGFNALVSSIAIILLVILAMRLAHRGRVWPMLILVLFALSITTFFHYYPRRGTMQEELVADWLTDNNPTNLLSLKKWVKPHEIILSTQPWNVVWWTERPSLPIPEYPDQIYVLMGKYGMAPKLGGIYIGNLGEKFTQDINAPYSFEAYRRMARYGYTLAGFNLGRRFTQANAIFLYRDFNVLLENLLRTDAIVFGDPASAGHLVWGWDHIVNEGKNRVVWAIRSMGVWSVPSTIHYVANNALQDPLFREALFYEIARADAEVTFLVDEDKPKATQLVMKCAVHKQRVRVFLNSNLIYIREPGYYVGEFEVPQADTWVDRTLDLPKPLLRQGINKFTLEFSASKREYDSARGMLLEKFCAFDRINFIY